MNIPALKEKIMKSADAWIEKRVDEMTANNPSMAIPAVYIKRGCHNLICKYEEKINEGIDMAALFLADKDGNVSIDTFFTDLMEYFRGMEEVQIDGGIIKGTVGRGKIAITMPDNILTNIIFGSKKTITFDEADVMELKMMIMEG